MQIIITAITNPELRSAGYTHEYLVRNTETDLATRNGITKGMTWRKYGQLLRGETLDRDDDRRRTFYSPYLRPDAPGQGLQCTIVGFSWETVAGQSFQRFQVRYDDGTTGFAWAEELR